MNAHFKKINTWRERIGQAAEFPLHLATDVERAMVAEIAELRGAGVREAMPGWDDVANEVIVDRRDLFDFLRAAWRDGAIVGWTDEAESWHKATDHATSAIKGWSTLRAATPVAPRPTDDAMLDATMRQRDDYNDMADSLAEAIAKHLGVDIGEHSSANNPWAVALDAIQNVSRLAADAPSEPSELRKALIAVREALQHASDSDSGGIVDTLWMLNGPETVFDFIDATLESRAADAPSEPSDGPEGFNDHEKLIWRLGRSAGRSESKSRAADALDSQPTEADKSLDRPWQTYGHGHYEYIETICDAYESGIGDGLTGKALMNPYNGHDNPDQNAAFEVGHIVGVDRASSQPTDGGVRNG